MSKPHVPQVSLLILDGWTTNDPLLQEAKLPFFEKLKAKYTITDVDVSPTIDREHAYITMGTGQAKPDTASRLDESLSTGDFFNFPVLLDSLTALRKKERALHILWPLNQSVGNPKLTHLQALLQLCKEQQFKNVFIHAITDSDHGRNVGGETLDQLVEMLQKVEVGTVASIVGSYYALDCSYRWDRMAMAYQLWKIGKGNITPDAVTGLRQAYRAGQNDDYVEPIAVQTNTRSQLHEEDVVLVGYLQASEIKQLCEGLSHPSVFSPNLGEVQASATPVITLVPIELESGQISTLFADEQISPSLGSLISERGYYQLRAGESQTSRFIHYFFDGLFESSFKHEEQVIVSTPHMQVIDHLSTIRALEVGEAVQHHLQTTAYQFVAVSFCNYVTFSSVNRRESLQTLELIDQALGTMVDFLMKQKGLVMVVGTPNSNLQEDHRKKQPVPLLFITSKSKKMKFHLDAVTLDDIAPSILHALQIPQPEAMRGKRLITFG